MTFIYCKKLEQRKNFIKKLASGLLKYFPMKHTLHGSVDACIGPITIMAFNYNKLAKISQN